MVSRSLCRVYRIPGLLAVLELELQLYKKFPSARGAGRGSRCHLKWVKSSAGLSLRPPYPPLAAPDARPPGTRRATRRTGPGDSVRTRSLGPYLWLYL